MTILFIDSFNNYILDDHVSDKGWSHEGGHWIDDVGGVQRPVTIPPQFPLGAMSTRGSNIGERCTRSFLSSDTVVVSAKIAIGDAVGSTLFQILDADGNSLALLETGVTRTDLRLISGGVTVETTGGGYGGGYGIYELKYTKGSGSNGFAEVRFNLSVVHTITTSSATAQGTAVRCISTPGAGDQHFMDDFYILNGLGSAPNNDYLGGVRIDSYNPNSDGPATDFTTSTGGGSNYSHVSGVFVNDLTYNSSDNIGDRDLQGMSGVTYHGEIFGVQQTVFADVSDAGGASIDFITEKPSGTGEKTHGTRTLSTDDKFEYTIVEKDPDDDNTWTDARMAATDFGYKVDTI